MTITILRKFIFPTQQRLIFILAFLCGFSFSPILRAQMTVSADTTICMGSPVTLKGALGITTPIISLSLTDDVHSGVINITFPFTYFGNTYNQLVISSNNYLTFDLSKANAFSPWTISASIPATTLPMNSIMGPYQDINPGVGGQILYAVIGTAPNRKFVASYCKVPMYSCTGMIFTSQIVIFEGTNIIENHITNKPLCTSWNSGNAIHGLHNSNGSKAVVVNNRNYPTQWTTSNESYRFTPNGPGDYTYAQIPFSPVPVGDLLAMKWYVGTNQVGIGANLTVSPTVTTTYVAKVTLCDGVEHVDSVTVTVSDFTTTFATSAISCYGNTDGVASVYLQGMFPPFAIDWVDSGGNIIQHDDDVYTDASISGIGADNYAVMITDAMGCMKTAYFTISQPPAVSINQTQINNPCYGDLLGMASVAVAAGNPPFTYQWNDPQAQTSNTITNLPAYDYSVIITDANGCTFRKDFSITQPDPLMLNMTVATDTCERSHGTALVDATGGTTPYNYLWSTNAYSTALIIGLKEGTYNVSVTDAQGCSGTINARIDNIPSPVAKFDYHATPYGILDPTVTFFNQSIHSVFFDWSFGDGATTTDSMPVHFYNEPGNYPVMLISSNIYGCADTLVKIVKIPPLYRLYIPNAFRPSSEFGNVGFGPEGEGYLEDSYLFQIFDKWGKIVFKSRNFNEKWDGTSRFNEGAAMPGGVYVYLIEVKEHTGFARKYYGHVTLVR